MIRRASVAGSFYPANHEELIKYFTYFSEVYDKHAKLPQITPKAVIVPHAGHIYSGFTANIAYRLLQKSALKRFVIIGPSHKVAFVGSSMCDFESYATPFGALSGDRDLYNMLVKRFIFNCYGGAHAEHSTEVQFPFVKFYIPDAKIIEIVYGDAKPSEIAQIITYLLELGDTGVIISTGLSHFYSLDEANQRDAICIEAINNLTPSLLHQGCEACGKIGVEAMLIAAKKLQLTPHILDYRTSADASGDTQRVVGYLSVAFK